MFQVVTCTLFSFPSLRIYLLSQGSSSSVLFWPRVALRCFTFVHRTDAPNSYPHAAHLRRMGLQTLRHDCLHPTWPRAFYFPEPVLLVLNLNEMTFVPAVVLTQIELNSLICKSVLTPLIHHSRHIPLDVEGPGVGCNLSHASPIIIVAYILLVICETGMFSYFFGGSG